MKKAILCCTLFCLMANAYSQNVIHGEYFIGTDPGFGTATSFTINPTEEDVTQVFNILYSAFPSSGYHAVFFRTKDDNGCWSHTARRLINVGENTPLSNIIKVEYFFETDNGFGNNSVVSLPASSDSSWHISIPQSQVPVNWNSVFVRVMDSDDGWSHTTATILCVPDSVTDVITACDAYTWIDGNTYTESNSTATYIIENAMGCDSVVTLNLTLTVVDTSITGPDSTYTLTANVTGANYQWLNCVDGPIANATGQSYTPTSNGSYAVEVTINGCSDTSACRNVDITGIEEPAFSFSMQLVPNPNKGIFELRFNKAFEGIATIHDLTGRLMIQQNISSNVHTIYATHLSNGIYIVSVTDRNGHSGQRLMVVD